ncbi:MAG: ribonuclease HII [Sarcina ventriculi]|uniref:ribonuclease HII n=1 Tax=Sarcina ventriculi TaxID=1267 RepID=UPI00073E15E9|nr:ribonuclease HII [Sarcina ventriculi]MDY7063214.1 ribonuclease HII [Sarcina ventriculi]SPZ50394.1 Ribonuclease HII [Sarcina ventriculi]
MENLLKIKQDLTQYSFKVIKESVDGVKINKDSIKTLKLMEKILLNDSRKNVIGLGSKLGKSIEKYIKEQKRVESMYKFDKAFLEKGFIAGVDEVGRGPLAGPIVACAVILDLNDLDDIILDINDSKLLSRQKREELDKIIRKKAISFCIAEINNKIIDEKGIGYANNKIFIDACNGLSKKPDLVLSDGYLIKNFNIDNKHIIKGDRKSASIACASILAKVYRDNIMRNYHKKYPNYDFENNVGYGTKNHLDGIKNHGITPIHRKSFLKNIINNL